MRLRLFLALLVVLGSSLACVKSAQDLNTPLAPTLPPLPTTTFTPAPTATPQPTPTPIPGKRIESGEQALFDGDWQRALTEFGAAQSAAGADTDLQFAARLGQGRAYLMGRNTYQATTLLQALVQELGWHPQAAEAYFLLGQVYAAQQRYAEAAEAYQNYLILRPGVIDAYVLDRRGDALFAAGDYPGAAQDLQAALQAPGQLDQEFLQLKLARAYTMARDDSRALALYTDLYFRTQNDNTRALIDLRLGGIYTAQGQTEQAQAAYLDAVENYPKAYEAYLALVELVEAGVEVDELQRGIVDYFAAQYGPAAAAFDRYLQGTPADPALARYYYGLTLTAQGGHVEAIKQWDLVIQNFAEHPNWDKAWEMKAYVQWNALGDNLAAIRTLLNFVERVPTHPRAGEFLYDAALAAERHGDLKQAADLFERVINLYPGYEQAGRSLFLAGLSHYRLGDYEAALLSFIRFAGVANNLEDRALSQLWIGKTEEKRGNTEAARQAWQVGAAIDPTGYYSERARDLLDGRTPFQPPQSYDITFDPVAERQQAEAWLRRTFNLPAEIDLSGPGELATSPMLLRGEELWRLGLFDQARLEFAALQRQVSPDPAASYRLANYLISRGAYRLGIQATRQILDLALLSDAETLGAPAYFNHLRFGTYYSDLVFPLAQEFGFHPLFLFSLIRQESLFEGFVRSTAGARGLMQIMPATGDEIVKNLGWPPDYSAEDLYLAAVNLRLGVVYLDKQRTTFGGDLYATLAAYNGGPGNAYAWKKTAGDDPDLFLEVIRFVETRKYIRGVYELFTIYRLVYERAP